MDLIELPKYDSKRHPWELSRADSLISELKKYHYKGGNVLDIGCGDLYFDKRLTQELTGISELWGVDINATTDSNEGICYWVNSFEKLPKKKFNTILMLDVLEHIEDDSDFFINTVIPLLAKRNSSIILTVPAFQFLFSKHDRELKHYRRYNIQQMYTICKRSGLIVSNYHYFYFLLLPLRIFTLKRESSINSWKFSEDHILTKITRYLLNTDYRVSCTMGRIGIGLSLFVVIKRN